MKNHFELFDLPARFAVDPARLEQGYRDLQSRVHPDRFATSTDADRRLAMQWATRANEAYSVLKNPLERARYLLHLRGYDTEEESNTAMPPDFLMQQMEWRETVAQARGARDAGELNRVREELGGARRDMLRQLERALDADANFDAGRSLVRKLRFLEKLDAEIDEALEPLEH